MSMQPESGPPVMKLYAIELPDGSIAMNGPYVLATENEGQAGRMAHARDGQEVAFVRELQQAQPQSSAPVVGDDRIMQAIARGWCSEENSHKEMDVTLAKAIHAEVMSALTGRGS